MGSFIASPKCPTLCVISFLCGGHNNSDLIITWQLMGLAGERSDGWVTQRRRWTGPVGSTCRRGTPRARQDPLLPPWCTVRRRRRRKWSDRSLRGRDSVSSGRLRPGKVDTFPASSSSAGSRPCWSAQTTWYQRLRSCSNSANASSISTWVTVEKRIKPYLLSDHKNLRIDKR